MHDYDEDYGWNEYDDNDGGFEPNYSNYQNHRYGNAYGNYRGGYDRCNQGPPMPDFGPPGPPNPFYGSNYGPPNPPNNVTWKRGYDSPRNAMHHKNVKYLLRCGVAKENLKNLPIILINMMEPDYCGICCKDFDSFQVSRMHYGSKNHLKNQRKWLHRNPQLAPLRGTESLPMKSRELYCELCDVHITSKDHADSHYNGKSHRATVEGRKNPRNPLLLQPYMQDRLRQVIRREKKNLSIIEEPKPLKEAKNASSDFYCQICKAFMTCSEQMTSHMNGKKHLNKEKQHILKLMKGEDPNKGKDSSKPDDEKEDDDVNNGEEDELGEGEKEDQADTTNEWSDWNDPSEVPDNSETS